MAAIDDLVHANAGYARSFPGPRPARPSLGVAVVTCMDCRIDVLRALGLDLGDAHVLRNAGGVITDDVLRSLAISQRKLGTREIVLLHHTECGMNDFDDAAFRAQLEAESGAAPGWDAPGFADVRADVRTSMENVLACPWLPHRDEVRGFVFDVATGAVEEVR